MPQKRKITYPALSKLFPLLVEEPKAVECSPLKGIAQEGEKIIVETNTAQRNVGLTFAGQKAEHYEIATYRSVLQFAKDMGQTDIDDLLLQTLTAGKVAKDKLPELATGGINCQAAQEVAESNISRGLLMSKGPT
jgi:ferritin-like metal-binding protein YciE